MAGAPEITRDNLRLSQSRKVKWRQITKRKDVFGRLYVIWVDRNNLEPTGQVERYFTTPHQTVIPDEFLKFPQEEPWKVETDFEGYARLLKRELVVWHQAVRGHMKRLYGALGIKDADQSAPTAEALAAAGPPPQDWRLIVLAGRGDPWCLGLQRKRTKAVEAIIGKEEIVEETDVPGLAADLRLDPELEALVGKGPKASRIQQDAKLLEERARRVGHGKAPKKGGKGKNAAALERIQNAEELEDELGVDDEDDDEGVLVGSGASAEDDELEDLMDVEESADPGMTPRRPVPVGQRRRGATRRTNQED